MSNSEAALPIGPSTMLHNKYQPIEKIGSGNFGEVWLAEDLTVNHKYAIKILKPGLTVIETLREARVGHAFLHNNLVRVHQADVLTDGRAIIAMDFLPDGPITTLANPANFIPLPEAVRFIREILQGLEHLHARNVFHNDIKPENILRGPQGQAKLGDYGIVGISPNGQSVPAPSSYIMHVAPETINGNGIEVRTDIFQTGLTFFRLLNGLGVLQAKMNSLGQANYVAKLAEGKLISDSDFLPFIPRAAIRVVRKAIHPDPSTRYQSALEMRRDLERLSCLGYWTIDPRGEIIGEGQRHQFSFSVTPRAGGKFAFKASKINKSSQRVTQIAAFSRNNITEAEIKSAKKLLFEAVIDGTLV